MKETLNFLEMNLDITTIINSYREIKQLKYLLLDNKQKGLYCLQTVNINDDKNCYNTLNFEDYEDDNDKQPKVIKDKFVEDREEFEEMCFNELEYDDSINKNLMKNYIRSTIWT